jgi:hypothetical protein
MVTVGDNLFGSQFFIALDDNLDYLVLFQACFEKCSFSSQGFNGHVESTSNAG